MLAGALAKVWLLARLAVVIGAAVPGVLGVLTVPVPAAAQTPPVATPPAAAEPAIRVDGVPPVPENVIAAKAYGTLERHCARCHQAGRLQARPPAGGIANILALDEIARDPALIRPGVPDASPLYLSIIANRMPPDMDHVHAAEPEGSEVEALRDWIAELPPQAAPSCPSQPQLSAPVIAEAVAAHVARLPPDKALHTRFISLAALHNACVPGRDIDVLVQGIRQLLATVGRSSRAVVFERIDPAGAVLAVDLREAGWSSAHWEKLSLANPLRNAPFYRLPATVQQASGSRWPMLAAGRLAALALPGHDPDAPSITPADAAVLVHLGLDPALTVWGLPPLAALLHAHHRPVALPRAAADFGVAPAALLSEFGQVPEPDAFVARLLRNGVAARTEVDRLLSGIAARMGPVPDPSTSPPAPAAASAAAPAAASGPPTKQPQRPFALALWSDKPGYAAGDTAAFHAQANADCYLTVVGIDTRKRATVLFPNDFERDNKLAAGRVVQVPGPNAGYRFRFKQPGRETIVGICSRSEKAPDGIVHDFERLRFTVLGDWRIFLRDPPQFAEARRDDAATAVPRAEPRRRGRRGKAPQKDKPTSDEPDVQARAAIVVNVE